MIVIVRARCLLRLCLLFVLLGSSEADAKLIQWVLHDVAFDDGGVAGGSFTNSFPDNYPGQIDDPIVYDVQTSGGRAMPTHYALGTADALVRLGFGPEEILLCNPYEATFVHQCLHLVLNELLPSNGGVVQLAVCKPTAEMDCPGVEETGLNGAVLRHAISGELIGSPVPETPPTGFLAAGLLGMIAWLLRQRAGTANALVRTWQRRVGTVHLLSDQRLWSKFLRTVFNVWHRAVRWPTDRGRF